MFELQWCEPRKPNANGIRYDHTLAESPIGLFSIEWKSWKSYPDYVLYLEGEVVESFDALDQAKVGATAHILEQANKMVETAKLVLGEATMTSEPVPLHSQYVNGWHSSPTFQDEVVAILRGVADSKDGHLFSERMACNVAAAVLTEAIKHPDTERIDFMETHIVIAGAGQGLRNAVDVARQMVDQAQTNAANSGWSMGTGAGGAA